MKTEKEAKKVISNIDVSGNKERENQVKYKVNYINVISKLLFVKLT